MNLKTPKLLTYKQIKELGRQVSKEEIQMANQCF